MGPFRSQHVAPVRPHPLSRQIKIGNVFMCHETVVKGNNPNRYFSFLFLQQFNSMLPTKLPDLRHKQHTNLCKQHVLNLDVLVSLCSLEFVRFILALRTSAWFNVISNKGKICVQSFPWTYERTALPYSLTLVSMNFTSLLITKLKMLSSM